MGVLNVTPENFCIRFRDVATILPGIIVHHVESPFFDYEAKTLYTNVLKEALANRPCPNLEDTDAISAMVTGAIETLTGERPEVSTVVRDKSTLVCYLNRPDSYVNFSFDGLLYGSKIGIEVVNIVIHLKDFH